MKLKQVMGIDWNWILAAQSNTEIRAGLYGVMKNIDRIRAEIRAKDDVYVGVYQSPLPDPYAPHSYQSHPVTKSQGVERVDPEMLETLKEQVREMQFMHFDFNSTQPEAVHMTGDRLQPLRNVEREDAPT